MSKSKTNAANAKAAVAKLVAPKVEVVVVKPAALAATGASKTGLRIQKDRLSQNGKTRPSAGGKCAAIWDECDRIVAAKGTPTVALLRAFASAKGYNSNNAQIELYAWRKFSGISGRVVAPAVAQPTA